MECPVCLRVVYRQGWSKGQRRAWSPYAHGLDGCKTCRRQQWCEPEVPLDVLSSKTLLVQHFANHLKKGQNCTWWLDLISKWMQQLDLHYRKQLSYLGRVRCVDETHKPAVYVNAYLGETLDPGNDSYAMLHKIVVPSIVKKS